MAFRIDYFKEGLLAGSTPHPGPQHETEKFAKDGMIRRRADIESSTWAAMLRSRPGAATAKGPKARSDRPTLSAGADLRHPNAFDNSGGTPR